MWDIVIRPSGIWDTRTPFSIFTRRHLAIKRAFSITTLALFKARRGAPERLGELITRNYFVFKNKAIGALARRAWHAYRHTFPLPAEGLSRARPTLRQIQLDTRVAQRANTEHAIIAYTAAFETYIQCWALNYLLARVECGHPWTSEETKLIRRFARVQLGKHAPNFPALRDGILPLRETLQSLPDVQLRSDSEDPSTLPVSEAVNALRTVEFWRDYRNLLVHSSSLVSARFYRDNATYVDTLRESFPDVPQLEIGKPLELRDYVFYTVAYVHFGIARALNEVLESVSASSRGEISCSGSDDAAAVMLREGDHAPSLAWTRDGEFRGLVLAELASSAASA